MQWFRLELERDVLRYAEDPSPITQGIVNMDAIPQWEPPWDPNIAMRDRAEAFRIGQLNAWGRWIWLAAELIPAGLLAHKNLLLHRVVTVCSFVIVLHLLKRGTTRSIWRPSWLG